MIAEIRALRPDDDRSKFRSGDPALDLFFHRYAGQNQLRHHIGVTYLAVSNQRILGFATVSPATLDAEAVPSGRRLPPYPVPLLRIARLATAETARGLGVGKALLRHCVELAEKMQDEVGCVGVLVDAKPEAAKFLRAAQLRSASRPSRARLECCPRRRRCSWHSAPFRSGDRSDPATRRSAQGALSVRSAI